MSTVSLSVLPDGIENVRFIIEPIDGRKSEFVVSIDAANRFASDIRKVHIQAIGDRTRMACNDMRMAIASLPPEPDAVRKQAAREMKEMFP